MPALLLVSSAFLHAGWNALIKRGGEPRLDSMGVLLVAACLSTGLVLAEQAAAFPAKPAILWALAAGICEGGYFLTLAAALERGPLGKTYTITRGGAMILVWLVSAGLLAERVSVPRLGGASAIFFGLLLTQRRESGGRFVGWAYASAAFIAGYHFFYAAAMRLGASPAALFALSVWLGLAVYLAVSGGSIRARLITRVRAHAPLWLTGGAVCAASFLLFLRALHRAEPGFAISLRNTSVLFAQVFAWLLGERPDGRQVVGAGLVALGAAWLAAG